MDRVADEFEQGINKVLRYRILWMVQHAKGSVLDYGCSQGIATELCRQKGCDAIGYDWDERAVSDASARYPNCKFTSVYADVQREFDTVLLGEVLEHQDDPDLFIKVLKTRVKKDGKLIITTPHGLHDYIDHKQTFTMTNFLPLIEPFGIEELEFVDGYIRCICSRKGSMSLPRSKAAEAEKDLVEKQRWLMTRVIKAEYKARERGQWRKFLAGQEITGRRRDSGFSSGARSFVSAVRSCLSSSRGSTR